MAFQKFEPTFDSLRNFTCPDWFRDAKFGIWSHWGPQSVPMYGDWYARHMYMEGTPQYQYHIRKYGHPSKFGYKDICALWKAENFDPDGLMDLYYKAGARYFVAQAMHHDHFFNYPSKLNRMNSMNVGPMKDICGLWQKAAKKYNMPFGLTEHLGATFSWWRVNKGCDNYGAYKGIPYDGNDPKWQDFYFDNYAERINDPLSCMPWYTKDKKFHAYWVDCMKELIDLFTPEMLYSDGSLPFGEHWGYWNAEAANTVDISAYAEGLEVVAYLYNASTEKYGKNRAIYTQKDRNPFVYKVGILDVEKSQLNEISHDPWQTDTCIGNWFYDVRQTYKKADQIIEMLIDIISKNGTMLLNVLQKPDGSIDSEAHYAMTELAKWFGVCAEGVYNTRPWKRAGEGASKVLIDGFKEEKTVWNETDFRFTQKDGVIYAFMMAPQKNNTVVIRSFNEGEKINAVRLLGGEKLDFAHEHGVLLVKLPEHLPTGYVNCIAVSVT